MKNNKGILFIFTLLLIAGLNACGLRTESTLNNELKGPDNLPTEVPSIMPSPELLQSQVTDLQPTPALTEIPGQLTTNIYTVSSNSGKSTATAYTIKESFVIEEILDKIIVQTENNTFEYSDIIGYYNSMQWSPDDTKLAVHYYGKQWGSFIVFDTNENTIIYQEPSYEIVRTYFEANGIVFDYEVNENRPDPVFQLLKWSEDGNSIQVQYSVKDNNWQTQSGSYWFNLKTGLMSDLIQNPPYQQG